MKIKYSVYFALAICCNIYSHIIQFVNSITTEEIRCNNCCFRSVQFSSKFDFRKCFSGVLSNNTFAQCGDVGEIFMSCSFEPRVNLEIKSGAFQNLILLVSLHVENYNIQFLPDRLFCNLPELTKLIFFNTAINDIFNKGFGNECGEDDNSIPILSLIMSRNAIRLLRNDTFIRLRKMTLFDVSHNQLVEIEEGAFNGLENLSTLRLSHNRLSFLPKNLFKNLKSLSALELDFNRLKTQGFPNMKYLNQLSSLSLDNNFITDLNMTFMPDNIGNLYIKGNPLQMTNNSFCCLPHLHQLDMSNSNLTYLDTNVFLNLTSLKYLYLTQNHIKSIDKELLKNCPIQKLYLSDNNISSLPDLNTPSLKDLEHLQLRFNFITNIDAICRLIPSTKLEYLDLSFNRIDYINDTFHCFTFLRTLKLTNNRIKIAESTKFIAPPDLRDLFLDYNEITSVTGHVFRCPTCEILALAYNNISTISGDILTNYSRLLNMSHNDIKNDGINEHSVLQFIWHDFSNFILDISFNKLTTFTLYTQWNLFKEIHANDNLVEQIELGFMLYVGSVDQRTIYLHNNKLTKPCLRFRLPFKITLSNNPLICNCELQEYIFQTSDSFKLSPVDDLYDVKCTNPFSKLSSGYQLISTLNKSETMLCKTTYKNDISCMCNERRPNVRCHFQCPSPCTCYHNKDGSFAIIDCSLINITFIPVINIENVVLDVYLDGNDIKVIDQYSFEYIINIRKLYLNNSQVEMILSNAFINCKTLQILSLSNNRLKTVSPDAFLHLTTLRQLDISNCGLSNLSVETLYPLKNIQILNLEQNLLSDFSFWNLNLSDKIQLISIQDNPWTCECEFVLKFVTWISNYSNVIDNTDELLCKYESGVRRIMNIDEFSHCYSSDVIVSETTPIWASVLAITFFLTIIAGLIFFYRREMQVLIYSRYNVRLFYRKSDADAEDKLFDVFVAYSGEDEEFVVNNLLPGLENIENPYKTCVHNRDFVAGGYITENIMEAVQISRRTLIVLTENFAKSQWCRFEFKTAHSEMLSDQRSRVIVVVIDEIPENVDKELQLYLKTKTYLKWEDRLFWKRLYFVLPDRQ